MKSQFAKKAAAKATQAGLIAMSFAGQALAAPEALERGANAARPEGAQANLFTEGGIFQTIANVLIFLVGAISVIMLIVGGLRYVLSGGNKDAVEGAKNTIFYAIIGLIVAILAFAAVRFVIESFG